MEIQRFKDLWLCFDALDLFVLLDGQWSIFFAWGVFNAPNGTYTPTPEKLCSSLGPLFRSFCVEFTKNTVYCGSRSTAIQRLLSIKFVSQRILGQTPQIISMDEVCKGISPQTTLDMLRITV